MKLLDKLTVLFTFSLLLITFIFSFDYSLSTFIFHGILPYDQQRILQLFLLESVSIVFFITPIYRHLIINIIDSMHWTTKISFSLFLYLGLVSAIFSKIPIAGFLEWSLYILLIFFSLCWCALALKMNERFYFLISALIFLVITAYLHPVIRGYLYSIHRDTQINLFPYFINSRFFTQFAVFTLALLPLADIRITSRKFLKYIRPVLFLLAGFWWGLVILNGARGIIYAFVIATIFGFIIFRKILLPWAWRQGFFILLGIVAVFLFTTSHVASKTHALIEKNLSHIDALSVSTTQQRAIIYKYTLQLIEKHPLLGVGPMHFAYAEPDILIKTDNLAAHPHNSILLILAEWGIPAGIFLLFFIMKTLFNFIKTAYHVNKNNYSDSNRKIIFASFAMSLGAGLLYSLVSGITVMPLPQTLLAVVAGSCVALYLQENPIEMSAVIRRKYIYITMLFFSIGFSVSTLTYHVVSTLPHLTQSEITWLEKRGLNTRFNPRFWLQGWLAEH